MVRMDASEIPPVRFVNVAHGGNASNDILGYRMHSSMLEGLRYAESLYFVLQHRCGGAERDSVPSIG